MIADKEDKKPKGSGWFATAVGLSLLAGFVLSFNYDLTGLSPYALLQCWLLFAAAVLLTWGANRVIKGRSSWTVGQNTMNFVVAVVGATIAIFALVAQAPTVSKPASGPASPSSVHLTPSP